MIKKLKKQRGITLIALIITVIILVILAAVSIRAITNMKIVDYAINGTQNYVGKAVEENKIQDDIGVLLENHMKKMNAIQYNDLPDGLRKYVLGPNETGIKLYSILDSNNKFTNDNVIYISAGSFSELYDSVESLEYILIKYKNNEYVIFVDSSGKTKDLRSANQVWTGEIDIERMKASSALVTILNQNFSNSISDLTENINCANCYLLQFNVNGENMTVLTSTIVYIAIFPLNNPIVFGKTDIFNVLISENNKIGISSNDENLNVKLTKVYNLRRFSKLC